MRFILKENYECVSDEIKQLYGDNPPLKTPFIHLLAPFAREAFQELELHMDTNHGLIGPDFLSILKRKLISTLFMYFGQTFQLEFSIFRRGRQSPFDKIIELNNNKASNRIYNEFIHEFYDGRWKDFFREYAVLAKIVSVITEYWVNNAKELIQRFIDDYEEITKCFSPQKSPGRLTGISSGVSDSHHHGKRVSILKLESGLNVVYKPKDLL